MNEEEKWEKQAKEALKVIDNVKRDLQQEDHVFHALESVKDQMKVIELDIETAIRMYAFNNVDKNVGSLYPIVFKLKELVEKTTIRVVEELTAKNNS